MTGSNMKQQIVPDIATLETTLTLANAITIAASVVESTLGDVVSATVGDENIDATMVEDGVAAEIGALVRRQSLRI